MDFWYKRFPHIAVFGAAALMVGAAVMTLFVSAPRSCPGWHLLYGRGWMNLPLWFFLGVWPFLTLLLPLLMMVPSIGASNVGPNFDRQFGDPSLMPDQFTLARFFYGAAASAAAPLLLVINCWIN